MAKVFCPFCHGAGIIKFHEDDVWVDPTSHKEYVLFEGDMRLYKFLDGEAWEGT